MEVSYPSSQEPTPEELKELEKLRAIIERSTADGVLTKGERETISAAIYADKKVTRQEMEILRTLIQEKVATGEIKLDYS